MTVGRDAGHAEARAHEEEFDKFFDRLPKEFIYERELLRSRLWRSPATGTWSRRTWSGRRADPDTGAAVARPPFHGFEKASKQSPVRWAQASLPRRSV